MELQRVCKGPMAKVFDDTNVEMRDLGLMTFGWDFSLRIENIPMDMVKIFGLKFWSTVASQGTYASCTTLESHRTPSPDRKESLRFE